MDLTNNTPPDTKFEIFLCFVYSYVNVKENKIVFHSKTISCNLITFNMHLLGALTIIFIKLVVSIFKTVFRKVTYRCIGNFDIRQMVSLTSSFFCISSLVVSGIQRESCNEFDALHSLSDP